MTYSAFETSQEGSQPVEVYTFLIGAQAFRYTSAEDTVTLSAIDYAPESISRGTLEDGAEERDTNLSLVLPATNPVARQFLFSIPGQRVKIQIDRYQRLDTPTPEVIRIFDGFVHSVTYEGNGKTASMSCRPAVAVLNRTIPRFAFHAQCNHVLYDSGCQVDDTDPAFRVSSGSVTAVSGRVLTVSGLSGSFADGFFDGGFVEVVGSSDFRMILSHTGNDLTLLLPFSTDPTTVNVFAGCDHSIATCKAKFDNVINFGGFPFVPTRNPFQTGIG